MNAVETYLPFLNDNYMKHQSWKEGNSTQPSATGVKKIVDGSSEYNYLIINGVPNGMAYGIHKNMQFVRNFSKGVINGYNFSQNENGSMSIWFMDMGQEVYYLNFSNEKIMQERNLGLSTKDLDIKRVLSLNPAVTSKVKELRQELIGDEMYYYYFRDDQSLELARKVDWTLHRREQKEAEGYDKDFDVVPSFILQNDLVEQVIKEDRFDYEEVKYIAGANVFYHNRELKIVAGIVVFDIESMKIVDSAFSEKEAIFPYSPGLYTASDAALLKDALGKLNTIPELIICNLHDLIRPNSVNLAQHIGIETGIPSVGLAKNSILGRFEELRTEKGSVVPLMFDNLEIGRALRSQSNEAPIYVMEGHKISLDSAVKCVVKMTKEGRLPVTIEEAEILVNSKLRDITDIRIE